MAARKRKDTNEYLKVPCPSILCKGLKKRGIKIKRMGKTYSRCCTCNIETEVKS